MGDKPAVLSEKQILLKAISQGDYGAFLALGDWYLENDNALLYNRILMVKNLAVGAREWTFLRTVDRKIINLSSWFKMVLDNINDVENFLPRHDLSLIILANRLALAAYPR